MSKKFIGTIVGVLIVCGVGVGIVTTAYYNSKNRTSQTQKPTQVQAAGTQQNSGKDNNASGTVAPSPQDALNSQIVPNGNIIYSAEKYAVPANEVQQMLDGKYPGTQKEIFLTFDDGPSMTNTPKILNILKQYGVHGTFFVVGSNIETEQDKAILRQELLDGNAIANHSYTHDYRKLYPGNSVSVSAFMNEMDKTNQELKSVLGSNFNARVVRMPGGYMSRAYYHDKNLPALNAAFSKDGVTSIDWSAETGDAESKPYTPQQLLDNAIKETKGQTHIVLLMHDIKPKTVESLPSIIEYYKSQGYEFKVISNTGIN
ncbi:MAG: polysaccharide deacetylase family protein [Sarcina sp.]